MPVEITIVTGARKGERIELDSDLIRVGDDPSYEVYFNPEDDPEAEGRRATLVLEESGWRIRKTGSELLWVNQDAVEDSMPLRSGDTVRMSGMGPDLRFRLVSAHDAAARPGTAASESVARPGETEKAVSPAAGGEVAPEDDAVAAARATHCDAAATDEAEIARRVDDRQDKRKLLLFGGTALAVAVLVFVALGVGSMLSKNSEELAMPSDDGGLPAGPQGISAVPKMSKSEPKVGPDKKPAPRNTAGSSSGVRKMPPEETRRQRGALDSSAAIAKAEEAALPAKESEPRPAVAPEVDPIPAEPASPVPPKPGSKSAPLQRRLRTSAEMADPPASKRPTAKPVPPGPKHLTPGQIRERLDSFAGMGTESAGKSETKEADEKATAVDGRADLGPATPPPSAPESRKPVPSKDALDVANRMLRTVFEPQFEAVKRDIKMQDKINDLARLITELKVFAEDSTRDDAVRYQAHVLAIQETAKLGQIELAIEFSESLSRLFELDEVQQKLRVLEQANFEVPGAEFRKEAQHDMLLALGEVMAEVQKTKRFEESYNGLLLADVLLGLHEAVEKKYSHEADAFSDTLRTARENQAEFRARRIQNSEAKKD